MSAFYPDAATMAEVSHLSSAECEAIMRNSIEGGSILKLYESQWPCCREFVGTIAIARSLMKNPHIAKDNILTLNDPTWPPATTDGLVSILQHVNTIEEVVKIMLAMTALLNHLAVGRHKLHSNGQGPPIPIVRLRSSAAFDQSEGGQLGVKGKDMAYQARAWAFECRWLEHTILPKWKLAAEAWRIKHNLDRPATFYNYTQTMETMRKKDKRSMKFAAVEVEEVPCHLRPLKEVKLEDLARKLATDSEKTLLESYVDRFKDFAKQWSRLYIQVPAEPGFLPTESLLAYTHAHSRVFKDLHRAGQKLIGSSAELEKVFYRAALHKIFDEDKTMLVLPMCSFDLDDPKKYRNDLLTHLGRDKGFPLVFLPVLIQRWQTNKLEKAVQALGFVKRKMEEWILVHGDDPLLQGIHLDG